MAKIDLHGMRHADVRNAVIRFIEDNWDSEAELIVVTGHSPKMKAIAMGVIKEYKLTYREGDVFGFANTAITITF
jgi:DNA-nicking Smr family endonuclease